MTNIDRLLQKTYRKQLWTPFIRAIKDFELIQNGDVIGVAISGGKDSFLLAKLFQELHRHGNRNFELRFFLMDPGYLPEHRDQVLRNAELLEIPLQVFSREVFSVAMKLNSKPCYLCARMRRGHLYSIAAELGCNKIALGHHFDDVIETAFMNVLSGGTFMAMMPKLHSKNFPGMELIRPLYYVDQDDIIRFTKASGLSFLNCACSVASGEHSGNRARTRELIRALEKYYPNIRSSIFYATKNVHTGAILGTISNGVKHSFLEHYDQTEEE